MRNNLWHYMKKYPSQTKEPKENIILIKTIKKNTFHHFSYRSNNILSHSLTHSLTPPFSPLCMRRKEDNLHTHMHNSHNHFITAAVLYTFPRAVVRSLIRDFGLLLSASLILLTQFVCACLRIQMTCPYSEVFISLTHNILSFS